MAKKKIDNLYTVIITNYNNENYLKTAIDSVLEQNYACIELIITDDGSKYFPKKDIINYINSKKRKNIKNVILIVNDKNQGTTKTINQALLKAAGDYILFFASDDILASSEVLSNYAKLFQKTKIKIIASEWVVCDINLHKIKNYIPKYKMPIYNLFSKKLLYDMCRVNCFGSGATSYKKEIFLKYKINDHYRLLEDWPFWLNLLKTGERVYFANFSGLLHRANGVSGIMSNNSTTQIFFNEMLETYQKEIIPYYQHFSIFKQLKILNAYNYHQEKYKDYINISSHRHTLKKELTKNKYLKLIWNLDKYNPKILEKIEILWKFNRLVLINLFLTILITFFISNIFEISNNQLLIILAIIYILLYYILDVISNLFIFIKRR